MLIEETGVPDAELPLEAFKAHLRLGSGFGTESLQDEVLVSFLRAAIATVEARTDKALIRRVFAWTAAAWADPRAQSLPVGPVQAVLFVALIARDGTVTLVDPDRIWLERDTHRSVLRPTGACLPAAPSGGSFKVSLEAGFAATWEDVPADLRQAVFLLAAHYYEFRHETRLSAGCMPFGVTSLLERHRNLRLGMGAGR